MPERNPYEEANRSDVEAHHIDDEVERRVRHRQLQRRLTGAQDEVVAALGDQKHLYFALEDLLGQRMDAREEALFNLGFERGLLQGRMNSLTVLWKNRDAMAYGQRIAQLTKYADVEVRDGVAGLLEIAWNMLVASERDAARRGSSQP
jgi:hypothetical protein